MRIVKGTFAGRDLTSPADRRVRPTAEHVRAALLDLIAADLRDARVLDLFAGTGALGLEALSRGAASTIFVESDAAAVAAIRRNAERLGATERARVIVGSALALPRSEPFDLVFADPPYGPGSGSVAVQAILHAGWLAPGGWLSVETSRRDAVDPAGLALDTNRDVGPARITLLRRP